MNISPSYLKSMTKTKSGVGYVVRFFNDKRDVSLFITRGSTKFPVFTANLLSAKVFKTDIEARAYISNSIPYIKKYYRGFMYISKVFYNTFVKKRIHPIVIDIAFKLTKPDKYDFIQAI